MIPGMTAKVTLSFSDDTIADARRWAQRDGVSLSAWIDQAARERTLRETRSAGPVSMTRVWRWPTNAKSRW